MKTETELITSFHLRIKVSETFLHKPSLAKIVDKLLTDEFCLQAIEHIISRMSKVRVDTLDRLFQIAIILGKATEDVTKLTGENMVTHP